MTAVIENSQETSSYSNIPWWRGNARLKDLSDRLLGAHIAQAALPYFITYSTANPDVPIETKDDRRLESIYRGIFCRWLGRRFLCLSNLR